MEACIQLPRPFARSRICFVWKELVVAHVCKNTLHLFDSMHNVLIVWRILHPQCFQNIEIVQVSDVAIAAVVSFPQGIFYFEMLDVSPKRNAEEPNLRKRKASCDSEPRPSPPRTHISDWRKKEPLGQIDHEIIGITILRDYGTNLAKFGTIVLRTEVGAYCATIPALQLNAFATSTTRKILEASNLTCCCVIVPSGWRLPLKSEGSKTFSLDSGAFASLFPSARKNPSPIILFGDERGHLFYQYFDIGEPEQGIIYTFDQLPCRISEIRVILLATGSGQIASILLVLSAQGILKCYHICEKGTVHSKFFDINRFRNFNHAKYFIFQNEIYYQCEDHVNRVVLSLCNNALEILSSSLPFRFGLSTAIIAFLEGDRRLATTLFENGKICFFELDCRLNENPKENFKRIMGKFSEIDESARHSNNAAAQIDVNLQMINSALNITQHLSSCLHLSVIPMGNPNRAVGPYIRSILKLHPPLTSAAFPQYWQYFIILQGGDNCASISVSLTSLYFSQSESGWIYDMPVGERFWRGVIVVRGFLVYHVDESRSSKTTFLPIFLPLSITPIRFSPMDFLIPSEASNIHLSGPLCGFSKDSILENFLEKQGTSNGGMDSLAEFPIIILRSTAQFVSENSMLSEKNFLALLLCPSVFDAKKLEQIESCIIYPFKQDPNSGLVRGMLPSGVDFEITVRFQSDKEIIICAALARNNSATLLSQCTELNVSLLERISTVFSYFLEKMPNLEMYCSVALVPNELLKICDSLLLQIEAAKIKQKDLVFMSLSEKEIIRRRVLSNLIELRFQDFNIYFQCFC